MSAIRKLTRRVAIQKGTKDFFFFQSPPPTKRKKLFIVLTNLLMSVLINVTNAVKIEKLFEYHGKSDSPEKYFHRIFYYNSLYHKKEINDEYVPKCLLKLFIYTIYCLLECLQNIS